MTAMTAARRRSTPSLPPHLFAAAEGEPAAYDGRRVCSWCGKPGRAGDAQHPVQLDAQHWPEVPAEVLQLEARRLGEVDIDG